MKAFADGEVEIVTVFAENRPRAFSSAVLAAVDPANVYQVTLLADNGRKVDRDDLDELLKVPPEYRTSYGVLPPTVVRTRTYWLDIYLFGGSETYGAVPVRGRVEAFAMAVMVSCTPEHVWRVALEAVDRQFVVIPRGDEFPDECNFDRTKKYGGITFDLNDMDART